MTWPSEKLFLIVVILLALWAHISKAYCIYNRMDVENTLISVYQVNMDLSTNFKKKINNGQHECCHWSNKSCNKLGAQDSPVHFHIMFGFNGEDTDKSGIYLASCYAGGGLKLSGNDDNNLTATCNGPFGEYRKTTLSITDLSNADLSLPYLAD